MASLAPLLLERERPAQVALNLDVHLHVLQMQRAQERGGLAQDRDDPRPRRELRDAPGGGVGHQVGGGGLAGALVGPRGREQREVLIERLGPLADHRLARGRAQLGREEPWLLDVGHEDLRVGAQHPVERGRPALGVADDEEVGHARRAAAAPPSVGRPPCASGS